MIIKFEIDTDKPKSIVEAIQYLEQISDENQDGFDAFDDIGGEIIDETETDPNDSEELI